MNTKHMETKLKNNIGSKQGNNENFLCDKCHLSLKKKKDLRKHTDNIHNILKDSKEIPNSDEINPNEVQGYSCKCTQETDYCLDTDGWVYYP